MVQRGRSATPPKTRARREEAETKNKLDSLVFQTEKFVTENADKMGASEKTQLESALANAKELSNSDDVNRMKSATDTLQTAYQAAAPAFTKTRLKGSA